MAEISTRKRGNKWEYRFEAAPISGKRKQISKGGFRTKKEALEAGTKALAEYNNSGIHFVPSEMSYADYLDFWIDQYSTNLKQTTIENYKKKIRLYIKPALGSYRLKSLSAATIQQFVNDMFNNGFSRNTLLVVKGIITSSLAYAVQPLGFIQTSPAIYVKLPSVRAESKAETRNKPHTVVTNNQMQAILKRFPIGTSQYIPLLFGYRCGMRLGEAFAVTWDNIDFKKETLTINKQVQWINHHWVLTMPKYNEIRTIRLDKIMLSVLKAEKLRQNESRLMYGSYYIINRIDSDHIINSTNGEPIQFVTIRENGRYISPRVMQHCSHIIHTELAFPEFDFHSLRHTHATMLLEKGANPKDVQVRLGHKNIDVTLQIYAHVTEKMSEQTIKILDQIG